MTVQEIKEKVKEISLELEKELEILKEEENFYDRLYTVCNFQKMEIVKDIDVCDFAIFYLKASDKGLSYTQIKEAVKKNKNIFLQSNYKKQNIIIEALMKEEVCENIDSIKKYFGPTALPITIKNKFSAVGKDVKKILVALKKVDVDPKDFALMLDLVSKNYVETFNSIILSYSIKGVKERWEEEQLELEKVLKETNTKLKEKEKNDWISECININTAGVLDNLKDVLSVIPKNYNDLITQARVRYRTKKAQYIACINFNEAFTKALSKEEIKEVNQLLKNIPDEKIRIEILKIIYTHNLEYYNKLDKTYNVLSQNNKAKYKVIFQEKGINITDREIESIIHNKLTDVKLILSLLENVGITDKENIISILKMSNLEIVKELCELKSKGFISIKTLLKNLSLFDKEQEKYYVLKRNLKILQEKNINPVTLSVDENLLLTPPKTLERNIEVLESYNLLKSIKTTGTYNFLQENKIEVKIDTILELGLEKFLEEDLNLLNQPMNKLKRIKIMKNLDVPIETIEELYNILTTSNFIIPDESLDEYIYNVVEVEKAEDYVIPFEDIEEPDFFKNFSNTQRTYKINDIIISKNKVKRNLANIKENLLKTPERYIVALTIGSTLNDEEYQEISSTIAKKLTK